MECQPSGPTSSEKTVARTSTRLDYEFTKSFLESAEQKFYNLSGTSPIGKTFVGGIQSVENFTLAAFGEVAGGAVGILKSVVRPIDKVFQKRKRFIAVNVIGSGSSESFHHSFRQIFIQLGVHVYYAYERQLNNIFLEADNGSGSTPGSEKHSQNNRNNSKKIMEDQLQAIQVLGWYAGSTCFYYMIAARTKENLLKALTLNKYSTKVASLWKARTREKLYYYHHKDKDWDFHHPDPSSKNVTRQDPKSGSVSVSVPLTPTPPIQLGKKCYVSAHEFFFKTSPVQVNFRDVISNVGQICTYLVKDESYNFGQTLMANIKEINQRNEEETQLHKENHFNIQEVQKEIAETKQLTKKTWETLEEIVEKIETILQNTSGGNNSNSVSKEDQGQSTNNANKNRNQNQMVPTKIRFNIREPVDSFTGREDFLKSLHASIRNTRHAQANNDEDSRSRAIVTTVVSGIEGIGKTEVVRMYTYRYGWYYDHIIWIDAKNRSTIATSFRTLATEMYPATAADTKDFEKLDKIAAFLQQVMKTLCSKSLLLLIFDNAQESNVEMVQEFLRQSLSESTELLKPTVVVTSPVSNCWGQHNMVFNIGRLSEDESVAFTLKQLSIDSTYENRKEALELGKLLHHFPPALQLAVGLIRERSKLELLLPKPTQQIPIYGVQNLIDDYKYEEKKLLLLLLGKSGGSRDRNRNTSAIMMVLCNVALDMLKRGKNGENGVKLLNTMAFLRPSSDIRKEFLAALFLDEDEDGDFHGALELLCDYSLVTKSKQYLSIHPLIQKGTISWNISKEQSPGVLIGLTEKLTRFWHNVISPSSPIYENFLETTLHVTNCVFEKLLALAEFSREKEQRKMLEFMEFVNENVEEIRLCEDGNVFERIMSHSDSTEISSEFHRKRHRYKSCLPLPFAEP